jgi:hypothetical protein
MKNFGSVISPKTWTMVFMYAAALLFTACNKDSPASPPVITSFFPAEGAVGASVVIKGNNFNNTASGNIVQFNGITANIAAAVGNELTVIVPEGATTGKISVQVGDKAAISASDFIVNPSTPVISSFSPEQGTAGTTVQITGTHFTENSEVYFGSVKATEVSVVSATVISVKVPENAVTDKIKVKANNLESVSSYAFIVIPVTAAFSPTHGEPGSVLTMTGSGFATDAEVLINGVAVAKDGYISRQPGKIEVKIPAGATSGKVTLKQNKVSYEFSGAYEVTNIWVLKSNGFSGSEFYNYGVSFVNTKNNKIYLALGNNLTTSNSYMMIYDPVANTWSKGPDVPAALKGLRYATAIVYNGKAYIGNGYDGSTRKKEWFAFDFSTNNWQQVASFPNAGGNLSAFVAGNKLYVGQGYVEGNIYEFMPGANSGFGAWNNKIMLNIKRLDAMSFVINDTVYWGGGINSSAQSVNSFTKYVITDNGYTGLAMASLPAAYANSTTGYGSSFNNKGYYMSRNAAAFFEYDPLTDTWTQKASSQAPINVNLFNVNSGLYTISEDAKIYRYVFNY